MFREDRLGLDFIQRQRKAFELYRQSFHIDSLLRTWLWTLRMNSAALIGPWLHFSDRHLAC